MKIGMGQPCRVRTGKGTIPSMLYQGEVKMPEG